MHFNLEYSARKATRHSDTSLRQVTRTFSRTLFQIKMHWCSFFEFCFYRNVIIKLPNQMRFLYQIIWTMMAKYKLNIKLNNSIHPFRFLDDMILGDGLALIGPYIQTEKNQSKSLAVDLGHRFWNFLVTHVCIGPMFTLNILSPRNQKGVPGFKQIY